MIGAATSPTAKAFNLVGLPLIFMRIDVAARLDPEAWTLAEEPTTTLADEAVLRHELRHFHDLLLTPDTYHALIVGAQGAHARLLAMAVGPSPQIEAVTRSHADAVGVLSRDPGRFARRPTRPLPGAVGLGDVLEALGTLTEQVHLMAGDGRAGPTGTASPLLEALLAPDTLPDVLDDGRDAVVHRLLVAAVVDPDHPSVVLGRALGADRPTTPDDVADATALARRLAEWDDDRFPALLLPGSMGDVGAGAVLPTLRHLTALREATVAGLLGDAIEPRRYDALALGLPVPPTVVYAAEGMERTDRMPFARRSHLQDHYGDVFSMGFTRDHLRRALPCPALLPTRGRTPCIPLGHAHLLLLARYLDDAELGRATAFPRDVAESVDQALAAGTVRPSVPGSR